MKLLRRGFPFLVSGFLFFAAIGTVSFAFIIKDLPAPELLEDRQVTQSTKIYDRAGEILLYEIHGEEKRTVISFEEIPERVKQATIAVEDANFYNHPAFDFKSIIRAFLKNLTKGRVVQGGSTITQQLAKNAFLTSEKTLTRKVKELALSFRLEKRFTKDEILNLYLNQIPYGSNAYGIEAASQTFFNKSVKDLSLAETALLASLPKAPSYYSPHGSHTRELTARKDYALDKMLELDFISEKEHKSAQNEKLAFAPQGAGIKAPHFVIAVQDYLNDRYGEEFVRTAGLKVITTLDWNLQQIAEKAVSEGAERNKNLYQGHNAALAAQDATTGQVLALVGSKDYFGAPEPENCKPGIDCRFEGNFNVAMQGLRQPGSAIKPLAYVTAFKKGYYPETVVFDLPTEFAANNPDCPLIVEKKEESEEGEAKNDECFHPKNFDEIFRGPVNLRNSLAQSINVPSVKTLYLAGLDNVLKTAQDFGVTTLTERSRYGLSLVLGGGEVKLVDLINAYSVFAQEGKKHKQTMILEIKDGKSKILEKYQDEVKEIVEPRYTQLINDILSDAEARSPLFQNSLALTVFPGHEVALKTGTTNDYRDAWAIGYTPSLVVGVWAGNNNNESMQKRAGSILAAIPIWNSFLVEALKERPLETFTKPEPVVQTKPMLNGQHLVNYRLGNQNYPQVHDLLFYIDRTSAQFENWEEPVLEWAKSNVANFAAYNQTVPPGAVLDSLDNLNQLTLDIISPANGSFVTDKVDIEAMIKSGQEISKLEVYLNEQLIDAKQNLGKEYAYRLQLAGAQLQLQNLLKITAFDRFNNKTEEEIILYK